MSRPESPLDEVLPPEDGPDGKPARQPLGSPFAVPLSALVAGAYVGTADQVTVHPDPTHLTAYDGADIAFALGGVVGPEGGGGGAE